MAPQWAAMWLIGHSTVPLPHMIISIFCAMQCNVWVFCGKTWGCAGCDWQAINYKASLGTDQSQRFGPYGPGCSQPDGHFPL